MDEKRKMLAGDWYISWDAALVAERERAKDLLFELNAMRPSMRAERHALLGRLLGGMGKNPWVESPFNCDYGYNITVGDNFYANSNCTILDCAPVSIGDDVLIGPNVSFYTPDHALDAQERRQGYERALPIRIGHRVWIGGSVSLLQGVSIGDNSIIGAGSVVTRDIPANVIAMGVPCRVVREITDADRLGLATG